MVRQSDTSSSKLGWFLLVGLLLDMLTVGVLPTIGRYFMVIGLFGLIKMKINPYISAVLAVILVAMYNGFLNLLAGV